VPTQANGKTRFTLRIPEEWVAELDELADKRRWPRTTTAIHCIRYGRSITESDPEPHTTPEGGDIFHLSVVTEQQEAVSNVVADAEAIDEDFSPVARRYLREGLGEVTED